MSFDASDIQGFTIRLRRSLYSFLHFLFSYCRNHGREEVWQERNRAKRTLKGIPYHRIPSCNDVDFIAGVLSSPSAKGQGFWLSYVFLGENSEKEDNCLPGFPPYHGYIVQYTLLLYQWERLVATLAMTLGLEHFSIYRSESRRFFFRRAEEGEEIRSGVLLYWRHFLSYFAAKGMITSSSINLIMAREKNMKSDNIEENEA